MKVEFVDSDRYATDVGTQCSNKCAAEGETLWVYIAQVHTRCVIGTCASCHDTVNFPLFTAGTYIPIEGTDIQFIKAAHKLWKEQRV